MLFGVNRLLCLIAFFVGTAALPSVAASQLVFDDWAVECRELSHCGLAQTVMSEDRIWLGSVVLSPRTSKSGREMALYVPQGAHLPSGIFIATGRGQMSRGEWISCDTRACSAYLSLDLQNEVFLKAGRSAELRYRPAPDAPVVVVDVSLLGITAGLAAIDASITELEAE